MNTTKSRSAGQGRRARGARHAKAVIDPGPFSLTVDISRRYDATRRAYTDGVLSKTEWDKRKAVLDRELNDAVTRELDVLGALGPLGVTIGTTVVVSGELIESVWGNQVRSDLLALNAGKAETASPTFTGTITAAIATFSGAVSGITPTAVAHLTRKDYVDTQDNLRALKTGDTFSGHVQVGGDALARVAGSIARNQGTIASCVTAVAGGVLSTQNLAINREGLTAGQPGDVGGLFAQFRRGDVAIGAIDIAAGPTTRFLTTSDPRLKEAGKPIANALRDLRKMAPLRTRFKGDDHEQLVFDAERVLGVMPHGVVAGKPGAKLTAAKAKAQGFGKAGGIDPLMMDYGRTTPLIAAAVLELEERLERIERKTKVA